jgi:hypothetical protein
MDPIPHLGDPASTEEKEYIITLKDFKDSEEFYLDMETIGGNLYIPGRIVKCCNRRPSSRNTHYMLTYAEAAQVREDHRVLTIELNPDDLGFIKETFGFEQTSTQFDKRVGSDGGDINWGLLRCLRKTDIPNWGINGVPEQTATIRSSLSGKNVDVVIMDDGTPFPTTIEFAKNSEGTGFNRMVEYNWWQHNPVVLGSPAGLYPYSNKRLQQHGAHVSGTVAGNSQGWARDADIYNLTFYDEIDYVREFHKNKPINPLTGVKNPTVMNNSWGYRSGPIATRRISKLTIRGVEYFPSGGSPDNYTWDVNVIQNIARINIGGAFPARNTATDVDMIEAMREGVIIVASAGNSAWYVDKPGGPDYDNIMIYSGVSYYIHRGSSPGSAWGDNENERVICVGASGAHNEPAGSSIYNSTGIEVGDYKAEFSNYGPRIDVFAPGSGIQSVWYSGENLYDNIPSPDPRTTQLGVTDLVNNNFKKCPGTSMSGPQVAGVLACIAEKYPRITVADAREYIRNSSPETLLSTNGGAQDSLDAGFTHSLDSCRKMLFLQDTRFPELEVGGFNKKTYPPANEFVRPINGLVYPRKKSISNYNNSSIFSLTSNSTTVNNGGSIVVSVNTTNVVNGTKVPYIITSKPTVTTSALSTSAINGVFSSDTLVSGAVMDTRPNTGNRITTLANLTGTSTVIANSLLGGVGLTSSTTPTTGNNDDGFWDLPLPFNISFIGQTYNRIFVGTNTYITFGSGSTAWNQLTNSNPPFPKIMITAADNSCQRIFYGVQGAAPNRTFRVRYEGHASFSGGVLGNPTILYEATFYENNPAQIDIQTGINNRWSVVSNLYNFSTASINNTPLIGTIEINDNNGVLPISITTLDQMTMNIRLGIHPAPNVNIMVN